MASSRLIIVTGPSGAGKGTLLRALEDRGFFCVDNLPVGLLTKFAELLSEGDVRRAALVVDVREGEALDRLPAIYDHLGSLADLDLSLFYLEASDDALIRRFSETRRPHPIGANVSVREAIAMEKKRLAPTRKIATTVVDTTQFSVHELRDYADRLLAEQPVSRLLVTLVSFGYKYGIPIDADMIFDVRFLQNPHFVPELRPLTGNDGPIVEYMQAQPLTGQFLDRARSFLAFLLPEFEREGKSYLTVAIGCTGGRHRSVMIANALATSADAGRRIRVTHRDVDK
jgi:UPF0042 nucleotide-binding protein